MNYERFLTARWNNVLALGLAIPLVAFAVIALATPVLSDLAGFIGMTAISVLY